MVRLRNNVGNYLISYFFIFLGISLLGIGTGYVEDDGSLADTLSYMIIISGLALVFSISLILASKKVKFDLKPALEGSEETASIASLVEEGSDWEIKKRLDVEGIEPPAS